MISVKSNVQSHFIDRQEDMAKPLENIMLIKKKFFMTWQNYSKCLAILQELEFYMFCLKQRCVCMICQNY